MEKKKSLDYCLYATYDKISGIYQPPFIDLNDVSAFRQAAAIIESQKLNPKDYDLYFLGDIELYTGSIASDVRFCNHMAEIKTEDKN